MSNQREPPIPAVGSRVRLRHGVTTVVATVLGYRGDRGKGRMIGVRIRLDHTQEFIDIEVPIDEVTLVESPH